MIQTYKEAEEFLYSFVNYEKNIVFNYKKTFDLKRVYTLFKCLTIPYGDLKTVHIAGTKGKGSTANFCAYIFASSDVKVGLYTSPHFFNIRERIRIVSSSLSKKNKSSQGKCDQFRNELIPQKELVQLLSSFEKLLKNPTLCKNLHGVSFFELYTALAFKYFLEKKVGLAVIETGLGGRLDATNITNPCVSIITHIGYDHVDKLGKKLSDIAYEKSGIIKEGVTVISAMQRRSVLEVIKHQAKLKNSPLLILGRDFKIFDIKINRQNTNFSFCFKEEVFKDLDIRLKGKHQLDNVALAIATQCVLSKKGMLAHRANFKNGISNSLVEGRFETIDSDPLTVADIAHNSSSFNVLNDSIKLYFPSKRVILVFGCCRDKDPLGMFNRIKYDNLIVTPFKNSRSFNYSELGKICKSRSSFLAQDIREALAKARELCNKDCIIVVAGSFGVVSEAKKVLKDKMVRINNDQRAKFFN